MTVRESANAPYSVVLTQGAKRDLAKLYAYIAEHSGERIANGYLERIQHYCQSLTTFPIRGRSRDDLKKGLRVVGFERRASIAFQVMENRIVIARVLYGGRDIEAAIKKS